MTLGSLLEYIFQFKKIGRARPICFCMGNLKVSADVLKNGSTWKSYCLKILLLIFACFSIKLNEVETSIKKPAWVTRDSISIDQKVAVYSATILIKSLFLWITQNNNDSQEQLPPSRHQGTISRRFHVLSVTFSTFGATTGYILQTNGFARNYKALLRKEAGLKTHLRIAELNTLATSELSGRISKSVLRIES